MKLYLVQHAKAALKQVDPERPLTEEGRQDIQRVAAFIKPLNLCVDYLWHSGKRRAVQTAEILAEVVEINKTQTIHDGLGPNDDVAVIRSELASAEPRKTNGNLRGQQDVMIVGHLPFLSKLASLLLGGSEPRPCERGEGESANTVAFKQGGIVCLRRGEENRWQIDWMVTPELLV